MMNGLNQHHRAPQWSSIVSVEQNVSHMGQLFRTPSTLPPCNLRTSFSFDFKQSYIHLTSV